MEIIGDTMKKILELIESINNRQPSECIIKSSIQRTDDGLFFIYVSSSLEKFLVVQSKNKNIISGFETVDQDSTGIETVIKVKLSNKNCEFMRTIFPWMRPVKRAGYAYSFGLGDRLGMASNAHLKLFKGKGVLPVLAQQSIRELNLTGRTYTDVLAAASWSVFEEGYMDGFGADGDHLKNPFEIDYAIKCGFPMITLDCSEYIHNEVAQYSAEELQSEYQKYDSEFRRTIESRYLNKTFAVSESVDVSFDIINLMETVLIFNDAINFANEMYDRFVVPYDLDFEISIDETIVPTSPENHFYIANELEIRNIKVETMAPKFYGEFQKAIDYVGDLDRFEKEYIIHEAIAQKFGYRLSIHSGSDKFKVYPAIGTISQRGWHVKTAGTNWLEALKVVAKNDPEFMLELYTFALKNLDIAKTYYHIDATTSNAVQLKDIKLDDLSIILNDDMSRQVLHVTFGLILTHHVDGVQIFKEKIYELLKQHSDDYTYFLNIHIGKHLELLNK